jgi:hypothetical protein
MRILLVSKEWSPQDQTGLGVASTMHYDILKKIGFEVKTVSKKFNSKTNYCINFSNFVNVIVNYRHYKKKIKNIIDNYNPDIVIVESLQTIISELFLSFKYSKKVKIVLFSHGISIYPYKWNLKYIFRSVVYLPYLFLVCILMKKINTFYSLNWTNTSNRHFDEKIYKIFNKNFLIKKYFNSSRFENSNLLTNPKINKNKIITCFGYMGDIKNQKDILKIAEKFISKDVIFRFVYQNFNKKYLHFCQNFCKSKNLTNVEFVDGGKVDIKKKIEESYLLINTSITEVFPLSLVESINLGVPFIAYNTGNISYMQGGLVVKNISELELNIRLLLNNEFFYKKLSDLGKKFYNEHLSNSMLKDILSEIL